MLEVLLRASPADGVVTARFRGALVSEACLTVWGAAVLLVGEPRVRVDLTGVTRLDSGGIDALLQMVSVLHVGEADVVPCADDIAQGGPLYAWRARVAAASRGPSPPG